MDPAVLDLILAGIAPRRDESLIVGFDHRDDATAYRLPSGEVLVQTVDFFTPVVDSPYDYGAIAAANSLSDIYAMNGRALFALNICAFPKTVSPEIWREVLRGGADKAGEAGIVIAGGHTIDDTEPKYGLVVTGLVEPNSLWSNDGARPGDILILTKPLGMGILTTALKNELVSEAEIADAIVWMKTLNRHAQQALQDQGIKSATDITGNGLLGHASEIARASNVAFQIRASSLPVLSRALPFAEQSKVPGGTKMNKLYLGDYVTIANDVSLALQWIMFDAQTSGGLLVSVPRDRMESAADALEEQGVFFAVIGDVLSGTGIEVVS
ncbi:MAG: selenide, water dikinase SelD [Calditrichaeota bacterium]|nr:selenide, water dikinase SelD [Calditrichota bacterium]MCB9366839.1 selenide, water dikinase SelD [Calditrichota bacterium]